MIDPTEQEARTDSVPEPVDEALRVAAADRANGGAGPDIIPLVRRGMEELGGLTQLKEFPVWFARFAEQTGLRLLLLKRWTSGLQVFMETNIRMPKEARQKRSDGRAPIPSVSGDIFQTVGEEANVYCGPVPVKHFPLDLTLMLGRGSRDRHIILLPLPSQNHWNTFLYLDSGETSGRALAVAEVLAHYALARMTLLQRGMPPVRGRVAEILRAETARRAADEAKRGHALAPEGQDAAVPAETLPMEHPPQPAAGGLDLADDPAPRPSRPSRPAKAKAPVPEADPFLPTDVQEPAPTEPEVVRRPRKRQGIEGTAAALPEAPAWAELAETGSLTPEMILKHSGELPALPKAGGPHHGRDRGSAHHRHQPGEGPGHGPGPDRQGAAHRQQSVLRRRARDPHRQRGHRASRLRRHPQLDPGDGRPLRLPDSRRRHALPQHLEAVGAVGHGRAAGGPGGRQGREPESVFIGGLMQNIGQLVLARSHPELFQEILSDSATRTEAVPRDRAAPAGLRPRRTGSPADQRVEPQRRSGGGGALASSLHP